MEKESSTRTTRLSGKLDERYETYRDDRDMTDAEALRSLLRTGLRVETARERQRKSSETKTPIQRALSAASVVFFGFVVLMQFLALSAVLPPLLALNAGVLFGALAFITAAGARAQIGDRDAQSATQSAPMEVAD